MIDHSIEELYKLDNLRHKYFWSLHHDKANVEKVIKEIIEHENKYGVKIINVEGEK